MSVVTNIVLSFSIMEESREHDTVYLNIEKINKWLDDNSFGDFGKDLDEVSGGRKHLETPLFAAAFNYFRLSDFVDFLHSLDWVEPENVQIFVQEQDENKFKLVEPFS
jgi:hypothetical protein